MARRHILGSRLTVHRRITQITTDIEVEGIAAGGTSVVVIGDEGAAEVVGAETERGSTRPIMGGEGEGEVVAGSEEVGEGMLDLYVACW